MLVSYLSNINGWIETVPNIHDNVRPDDLVISGQAVNLNLGDGHAIHKIMKRSPLAGFPVVVQVWSSIPKQINERDNT